MLHKYFHHSFCDSLSLSRRAGLLRAVKIVVLRLTVLLEEKNHKKFPYPHWQQLELVDKFASNV